MIPDTKAEDLWEESAAADSTRPGCNQLLDRTSTDLDEKASDRSAWARYRCFAAAMQSRGQQFDQRLLLEAMFRGSNLVYSKNNSQQQSLEFST